MTRFARTECGWRMSSSAVRNAAVNRQQGFQVLRFLPPGDSHAEQAEDVVEPYRKRVEHRSRCRALRHMRHPASASPACHSYPRVSEPGYSNDVLQGLGK